MKTVGYRVYPAVFVPILLTLGVISLAFVLKAWMALAAVPFIYLGSTSASPDLNLKSGIPAVLAIAIGCAVSFVQIELGSAIFLGAGASWVLSSFEQRLRAKPIRRKEG
ncbi:MAG: hypothetical protein PHQ12_04075 [Chthoniobacteraceae bacterium]|nr:hypothetical protein [Chthoniobacteraceae bacterium]